MKLTHAQASICRELKNCKCLGLPNTGDEALFGLSFLRIYKIFTNKKRKRKKENSL
ncbi:hypothetical protein AGMMS50284_6010 [Clostridia bacterium]|nr:hypothetical protein AGMMS50284_6010 [Clostridia bacterium]